MLEQFLKPGFSCVQLAYLYVRYAKYMVWAEHEEYDNLRIQVGWGIRSIYIVATWLSCTCSFVLR